MRFFARMFVVILSPLVVCAAFASSKEQETEQNQTQTEQNSLQDVTQEAAPSANGCEPGKKDRFGFYMCDGNNGCDENHHPNHATKWACANVGRTCNVCVAKDCDTAKGYSLVQGQGYCQYAKNAKEQPQNNSEKTTTKNRCHSIVPANGTDTTGTQYLCYTYNLPAGGETRTCYYCGNMAESDKGCKAGDSVIDYGPKGYRVYTCMKNGSWRSTAVKSCSGDQSGRFIKFQKSACKIRNAHAFYYDAGGDDTDAVINVCTVPFNDTEQAKSACQEGEPQEEAGEKKCKEGEAGASCVQTETSGTNPAQAQVEEAGAEVVEAESEEEAKQQQEAEKKAELEEKLKTAQAALDKAKEKENSWANRGLTAVSTAAAGLGAMQLAEGISEKINDAKAEEDMRAYITTMKCDYGNGQNIIAGNEEIFLPGGNELSKLYIKYKTLADNLKNTKAALGLRPGIESEVLYERAESNLYKNASVGKTGGGYASLSRAIMDGPESEDATALAKQKETSTKKVTAGGIATVVGVGGGAVGNYLINERGTDNSKK